MKEDTDKVNELAQMIHCVDHADVAVADTGVVNVVYLDDIVEDMADVVVVVAVFAFVFDVVIYALAAHCCLLRQLTAIQRSSARCTSLPSGTEMQTDEHIR